MKKRDRKQHKTVSGVMEIPVEICNDRKCKFYGKRAAQGVCWDSQSRPLTRYWESLLKQGEDFVREAKALRKANKLTSQKDWAKYLENHVICEWANSVGAMDELVYLRGENAKLRLRLGKYDSSAKPGKYIGPNERRVTKRNRKHS